MWSFAGAVDESAFARLAPNRRAAMVGLRLMGFYLFQSCPVRSPRIEDASAETPPFAKPALSYPGRPTAIAAATLDKPLPMAAAAEGPAVLSDAVSGAAC
jgi:hypothetical protein